MDYFNHALELTRLDAAQIDAATRMMDALESIDGGEAEAARIVEVACLAHEIDKNKPAHSRCPVCGSSELRHESACVSCAACFWSACD